MSDSMNPQRWNDRDAQDAPSRPTAYPPEWRVEFGPSKPLPPDYDFGQRTVTLAKGTVFPPAAMPLPCDIVWERDIPVTLRDGMVIYTDLLRPAHQTTNLPAIISWSPYGKSLPTPPLPAVKPEWFSGLGKAEGADAAVFASNGYAVLNPDARGAFKSQGNIHFWGSVEANDGYDVVEWAARQDWCNGKVALYGSSWLAISQWFIAAERPPHLAAIVPWNGFSDLYRDHFVWGGIPNVAFASGAQANLTGENQTEQAAGIALRDPLRNDYWEDKTAKLEYIIAPAYVVADGVTSLHPLGGLEGFRRIASAEKWLRLNNGNEWPDQYDPEHEQDLLRFLDHYLKGAENGWEHTPSVRVSVIDAGGEDALEVPYTTWPLAETAYHKLYLDAATGALSSSTPLQEAAIRYPGADGEATFTLTFDRDTQMVGYLTARLWVEAEGADDMDVFVLVEKLDADGSLLVPHPDYAAAYFPLRPPPGAHGRLRASLRELDPAHSTDFLPVQTFRREQKLSAGQVVPIDIALVPRAYFWHAGQQLRLTVAGYNVRYQDERLQTPNSGVHILHTGPAHESYLQVPIVPATLPSAPTHSPSSSDS